MINETPLAWTIEVAAIAEASSSFAFEATAPEKQNLAKYLSIDTVDSVTARVRVRSLGQGKYRIEGRFDASVQQASVINLQPVHNQLFEDFSIEYWPQDLMPEETDEEVPVDADLPELLQDGRIPIGALVSELMILGLDPYPRNEGEEFQWNGPDQAKAGTNPFAVLKQLKAGGSDPES